jgi:hypothetical protein
MQTIIQALRDIIGINSDTFYHVFNNSSGSYSNYSWDYGAMLEYAVAGMIVLVVISSLFKMLRGFFNV